MEQESGNGKVADEGKPLDNYRDKLYQLNEMQLDTVSTALTKKVTLIQGPPGSGKTYVGLNTIEELLANKDTWSLHGSNNVILVICYTNHALDIFLERILDLHKDGIIRVGDGSQSDRLKPFNLKQLRHVRKNCRTKMAELKRYIESIQCILDESRQSVLNEETLQKYMASEHFSCLVQTHGTAQGSTINSWLQLTNEDRKKQKQRLDLILTGSPTMSDDEARMTRNIWSMDMAKRESLYRYWRKKYRLDLKTSIQDKEWECRQVAKKMEEEDRDILAKADVIGMTATGASNLAAVLQSVAPRIMVVEEAAIVLETHNVSPYCEHLILIGNHQQLNSNPTIYDLARRYNQDISLYEKFVNQLHHMTLEFQYRMRPEISILMKHIYPKVKDHDSVSKFEDVRGADSNVFFISHEEDENQISESQSKSTKRNSPSY